LGEKKEPGINNLEGKRGRFFLACPAERKEKDLEEGDRPAFCRIREGMGDGKSRPTLDKE